MANMSGFRSFFPPSSIEDAALDTYLVEPAAEKTPSENLASAMEALNAEVLPRPAKFTEPSPLPKARFSPKETASPLPKADLFSGNLQYSAPAAKQLDITPAPVRQADTKTGTTVNKETEPVAPSMGSGGDEGPDRLAVAEALSRGLGAFHEGVTGQKLQNSIPEMLATLRQRREAQALKQEEKTLQEQQRRAALSSIGEMFEPQIPGARDLATKFGGTAEEFTRAITGKLGATARERGLEIKGQGAGVVPISEATQAANIAFADAIKDVNTELSTFVRSYNGPVKDAVAAYQKAKGGEVSGERVKTIGPVAKATIDEKEARTRRLNAIGLGAQKAVSSGASALNKEAPAGKPLSDYQKSQIDLKLASTARDKAFRGTAELANDLAELERIAPGSITKGIVPPWLTTTAMLEWDKYQRAADPKVRDFMTAFGRMRNVKRHEQYGSALNQGEIKASLSEISDRPLEAGPKVFIGQLSSLRSAAAKKAANDYRPYYETGARDRVDSILIKGTGADKHFSKNGVYADAGDWYSPAQAGGTVRMQKTIDGVVKYFQVPSANVEAAKARGYSEAK